MTEVVIGIGILSSLAGVYTALEIEDNLYSYEVRWYTLPVGFAIGFTISALFILGLYLIITGLK